MLKKTQTSCAELMIMKGSGDSLYLSQNIAIKGIFTVTWKKEKSGKDG